jgi:hypothetical protein
MKLLLLLLVLLFMVLLNAASQASRLRSRLNTSCVTPLYPKVMPIRCQLELAKIYGDCETGEVNMMTIVDVISSVHECDEMTQLDEIRRDIRKQIGVQLLFDHPWDSRAETRMAVCRVMLAKYEYIQAKIRKFFQVSLPPGVQSRVTCELYT